MIVVPLLCLVCRQANSKPTVKKRTEEIKPGKLKIAFCRTSFKSEVKILLPSCPFPSLGLFSIVLYFWQFLLLKVDELS